jgi:hypothetical protein
MADRNAPIAVNFLGIKLYVMERMAPANPGAPNPQTEAQPVSLSAE